MAKQTPSTEVAVSNPNLPANIADLLPDLVATHTAREVSARDVSFPRIKISHPSQDFVPDVVPPFSIYEELNKDDDNKVVLFELPKGAAKPENAESGDVGVLTYVLAMRKGKSANIIESTGEVVKRNTEGATFKSWAYTDPSAPDEMIKGVDVTYNYVIYVPEVDRADQLHKLLLTRTSTNTARTINSINKSVEDQGLPSYVAPFRLWVEKREKTDNGQKQRWGIFKMTSVAPEREYVEQASKMAALLNEMDERELSSKVFGGAEDDPDGAVVTGTVAPDSDEPAI